MSLKKDIIGAEVQIGSNEAQKSLVDLTQKTAALTNENDRLRISQAKLKALGKEHKEEYDKVTKAITENNKSIKENKAQMDALRKTIGLTEMSFPQLRKRAAELRKELLDMGDSADSAQFKKLNSELIATERQMGKLKGRIGETKGIMGSLGALMPVLGFAAIAAGVKSLVTNIINVRKEFEKYEAVLTNTLGSNAEARKEMQMLQKFASDTPFALTELTASFVKLTNYGLKPTKEEMRKYGDVAASVGKGFDQFAEAMADAVTGEFERLKEFGIKAKKEGDKIIFTFKEQTTVVDNNATSIKNYIAGLGDLQGVSGSMAAIAGTLGGKISNMGDAWDGLMNTLGSGTSGIMVTVITWMTNFVNMLDGAFKSIKQIKDSVRDQAITDGMNNAIQEIDVMSKSLQKNGMSQQAAQKRAFELYRSSMDQTVKNLKKDYEQSTGDQKNEIGKRLNLMIGEYQAVKAHYAAMSKIVKPTKSTTSESSESKKTFEPRDNTSLQELPTITANQVTEEDLAFAAKKHNEEEWTKFLQDQVEKQIRIKTAQLEIDKQIEQAREELRDVQIDSIGQIAGALSGMFEAGSAAAIAFFAIEKAVAIAQIWLNYAKESSAIAVAAAEMNAISFGTAGTVWGAIQQTKALTRAGVNTALVAAQAIAQVAKGSKQSGGFAETAASDSTPMGTYHANEFIGSAPTVRNPSIRKVYQIIDLAQKQGKAATLNLPAVMASMGMVPTGKQSGGFASTSTGSAAGSLPEREAVEGRSVSKGSVSDPALTAAINLNTQAIALLMKNGVSFPMVAGIKKMKEVEDLINQTGMGGFGK